MEKPKTKEQIIKQLKEDGIENPEEAIKLPHQCYRKYLENPDLFNLITITEFDKKIVGEVLARKVIFLCACGRLVKGNQIASYNLLVNDEAGVGKDYVTKNVLKMLPKEEYIHKTRISPTVFTYWHTEPEWTWDGKVFYPEDISETVLNSEVFKVMASEGSSATVVIKQAAVDLEIKGKPVLITTTASAIPNPELTRRFVILNLDSSEDQTKLIMERHSKYKAKGIFPEYDFMLKEALKFLKRYEVKVPFAEFIHEHFPSQSIIMRTNYPRFLDFICASAVLHQYQREIDKDNFLLAEPQDYDIARDCFLKLCSNKYMIPLTINQKRMLKVFESNPNLSGSVTQLHAEEMNFLSVPALQTNLGLLTKYGILRTRKEMNGYKEVEVYYLCPSYDPKEKLTLPTFEEIINNKNNIIKGGIKVIKDV